MIYLDNAATTYPKPQQVIRAMRQASEEYGANPGRSGHRLSMRAAAEVYRCRETAAGYFNTGAPERVVFTLNATMALNIVIKGLFGPKDHVLTSQLEHNSVLRPLKALEAFGTTVTAVPVSLVSEDETVDAFESQLRPNTRAIVCTHASNVCGHIMPLKRLSDLCKKHGLLFIVDGAQSAGTLPIDMQELGIDYLCVPGHKGLYGPQGTGMVLAARDEPLRTLMEGGTGTNSTELVQPEDLPERLESGTVNLPGIAGLRAGMEYIRDRHGELCAAERRLYKEMYEGMANISGVRLYGSLPECSVPVISFTVRDMGCHETAFALDSAGICVRSGYHCAALAHALLGTLDTGTVRASLGIYTTREDVRKFLKTVNRLAR